MLPVNLASQLLGLATIFAQVVIVVIVAALLFSNSAFGKLVLNLLSKKAYLLAFLVSFAGVAGSLYYSDFIGFEPCKLCWWQRVFMYPQAILLAMGLITRDKHVADYCIVFSVVGALIAGYQTLLMLGFAPNIPCSASGVSCSQIFVLQYGYITIPVMALTAFLLIIALLSTTKVKN